VDIDDSDVSDARGRRIANASADAESKAAKMVTKKPP
jgi:hypothetical protein